MTEKEAVEKLTQEGYTKVFVWDAEPNEDDPDHTHPFDTKLHVLGGKIEIGVDGKKILLKENDEIEIPKNKIHSGLVGAEGCKYVVAEKNHE